MIVDKDGRDVFFYDEKNQLVAQIKTNDKMDIAYKINGYTKPISVPTIQFNARLFENYKAKDIQAVLPEYIIPDEIKISRKPDVVGFSADIGGALGGGYTFGFDIIIFLNGPDRYKPYYFPKAGISIGYEISASFTYPILAWASDPKYVNQQGWSGWCNSYNISAGTWPGGNIFWVNSSVDESGKKTENRKLWFDNPIWWGTSLVAFAGAPKGGSSISATWKATYAWQSDVFSSALTKLWEFPKPETLPSHKPTAPSTNHHSPTPEPPLDVSGSGNPNQGVQGPSIGGPL